jgi:N-acetylmuramoyl-L-alanine amidase
MRVCSIFRTVSRLFIVILLMFTFSGAIGAATGGYDNQVSLDTHYQQAKFFYNQLKVASSLGKSRDHWLKGAGNFRRIYLAEPKSDLAPACLFMLGRLYFDMYKRFGQGIDLGDSLSYFRDVDALFPGNRLADDALMAVAGILLEEMDDPRRAAAVYRTIVSDYPEADMRARAEAQLKILSQEHDIPLPPVMVGNTQHLQLTNILPLSYWSSDDYTRVVIKASNPVTYHFQLSEQKDGQPPRLFIDFHNSYIEPRFRTPIAVTDGLLKEVRSTQFAPDTVRVVLDTHSLFDYQIFSLPDPFRVIIDVRGAPEVQAEKIQQPLPRIAADTAGIQLDRPGSGPRPLPPVSAIDPGGPMQDQLPPAQDTAVDVESEKDIVLVVLKDDKKNPGPAHHQTTAVRFDSLSSETQYSLAQQLGLGVGTIILDPGHGGKDPGAIAYGLKEKDIVLNLAKKLAVHLENDLRARVVMTRDDDRFLALEERTAIANTNGGDLFISLHVNAHPSSTISGVETYFLNLSTSDEAMRVAARENATSTNQMSDLQDILADILQHEKINESSRLAHQVHDAITSDLSTPPYILENMGVKQAPFYVLLGAEMPAILLEIAFISNAEDAGKLQDDEFLNSMAASIAKGIQHYSYAATAQLESGVSISENTQ